MKIGVCGIVCEKCPRMTSGNCPNGEQGCKPKEKQVLQDCNTCIQTMIRNQQEE